MTEVLQGIDLPSLEAQILSTSPEQVQDLLGRDRFALEDFPLLISPAAASFLETMAVKSRQATLLRFGKIVRLYAPLYISNECINACSYCGFNRNNEIERVTLSEQEVLEEAALLHRQGFRHILLVSGEAPDRVPPHLLRRIVETLSTQFAGIAIEVYAMDEDAYRSLAGSGVTGIAIYQETYRRDLYAELHQGPKADFDYRLLAPDRAAAAGFRELGIGALLGLSDFRLEVACVAHHAAYLMKRFWRSQVAVSFPRLCAAAGGFAPRVEVTDRDLAQIIFALRMVFPDVDLVLSTREHAPFRNGMAGLGITRMSAGSRTNPGGYGKGESSLEQFEVADHRPPEEVARMLDAKGLEPVWKDFDAAFLFEH